MYPLYLYMNRMQRFAYVFSMLFGISFIPIFSYAADISVMPNQQIIQCWPTDLYIGLNTSGNKVIAADIKFLLQWLSLSAFSPLSWFDQVIYVGTWISTKWTNIGNIYNYINIHQNSFAHPLTGNFSIAKITVMPIPGHLTGSLSFYNLSGNDEDSNISIWIEYWTEWYPIQYNDALSNTFNGNYTISSNYTVTCGTTTWCVGPSCPCTSNCWGGGWWGTVHVDDCKLPSTLACANTTGIDNSPSYYDNTCCSVETWHGAPICDVSDSRYSQEITDAFSRGYNLNITNKCPIIEARLDDGIRRKELAKMMTMFTIQIIGIYPDTHKVWCDQFSDVANISDEMKFFTKTACQLNLMGLEPNGNTPKKVFDPNDFVDRAQFGTILSRLIYGDVYNVYSGEETTYKWYEKHLRALYEGGIMNKIQDPFMLEKRARILLMLKRTNDDNLIEKYRLLAPAHNWALSLLENIW